MSRLTRRPSAMHLLSLSAQQAHTEQQVLRAEVESLKEALKRTHTAHAMLRDDVERFKGIARAQDDALRGLEEEVGVLKEEVAASMRLPGQRDFGLATGRGHRELRGQVR